VAAPGDDLDNPSSRLVRLPPGRHGLPREFVVQNQRDRLTAGMIAVVAERGYNEATITDIAAAAGVSRRTFYTYFASKEECFFATYDVIAEHMLAIAAEAAAGQRGWSRRTGAALGAVLEALATNPDLVRFTLIEPPRAGEKIAERLRSAGDEAVRKLSEQMPKSIRVPSQEVQRALLAGVVSLVARKVEAGEGEKLLDLRPELLELLLTPYLGRAEAAAVACS
jgi:AcrR family transcriptional regulator